MPYHLLSGYVVFTFFLTIIISPENGIVINNTPIINPDPYLFEESFVPEYLIMLSVYLQTNVI